MLASAANVRQLEHEKAVIAARQAKLKSGAEEQSKKLSGVSVTVLRKVGEQDKLFGSVTALDIAEALAAAGHKVDRRLIHLTDPIRTVGSFEVELRLHREVQTKVMVHVKGESAAA
jgi:large subunit ribosomal protein L9